MEAVFKSAKATVLVNVSFIEEFSLKRELSQRDSMSFFTAKRLSLMVKTS